MRLRLKERPGGRRFLVRLLAGLFRLRVDCPPYIENALRYDPSATSLPLASIGVNAAIPCLPTHRLLAGAKPLGHFAGSFVPSPLILRLGEALNPPEQRGSCLGPLRLPDVLEASRRSVARRRRLLYSPESRKAASLDPPARGG